MSVTAKHRIHVKALMTFGLVAGMLLGAGCSFEGPVSRIPITTSSDEAHEEYLEGRRALDIGRVRHARWRFALALREDPEFALAHLGAYETADDIVSGKQSFVRAVALLKRISKGEGDMILSRKAFDRGDLTAEHSYLRDLVKRYPDDARSHLLMGDLYRRRGNPEAAAESYREAARLAPDEAAPKLKLARIDCLNGRFDEAIEKMHSFVALDPDESRVQTLFGEILMKTGRFDEAMQTFRHALELDHEETEALIGLGNSALLNGDFAAAEETFSRLKTFADDEENYSLRMQALIWLAATQMHQENPDGALEWLETAASEADGAARPLDVFRLRTLAADSLLSVGQTQAATKQLDAAREQLERDGIREMDRQERQAVETYYRIRLALANGELERARAMTVDYRRDKVVARAPGSKNRLNELSGRIAMSEGDWRRAVSLLGRADQDDPRIVLLRSEAMAEQGQQAKARELLESIVAWNEARPELGEVLPEARRLLSNP